MFSLILLSRQVIASVAFWRLAAVSSGKTNLWANSKSINMLSLTNSYLQLHPMLQLAYIRYLATSFCQNCWSTSFSNDHFEHSPKRKLVKCHMSQFEMMNSMEMTKINCLSKSTVSITSLIFCVSPTRYTSTDFNKLCWRPPQYASAPASWPLTFDLLILKVMSESHVT